MPKKNMEKMQTDFKSPRSHQAIAKVDCMLHVLTRRMTITDQKFPESCDLAFFWPPLVAAEHIPGSKHIVVN